MNDDMKSQEKKTDTPTIDRRPANGAVCPHDELGVAGIIKELGELGPGAVIYEKGLASLFDRHVESVKRAITRGELPPPTKLFNGNAWTVGAIIRHIEERLTKATREKEKNEKRIARLQP